MGRTALAAVTAQSDRLADYPSCVVCGSSKLSELAGPDRMAMESVERECLLEELYPNQPPATQAYEARLLACDECGTLARDPHLSTRGAVQRYAEDAYHPTWMERAYCEYEAAFEKRMPELIRWVGPNARVLEVGSFVGGFLAAARRGGWRAEGVDVGDCVARFARGKGLDVHTGRLEERCFPSRRFDAVFIWSCFDQLPQPWEQLDEIHRILDDNGRLLLRVPNGEFVKRVQRLERWAPSESARESLRNVLAATGLAGFPYQVGYTPASLTRMLKDSGFGSVRVRNHVNLRKVAGGRTSASAKALRCVHAGSTLLHHATFGTVNLGPWIEVSCSKAPLTVAMNEMPLLCVA